MKVVGLDLSLTSTGLAAAYPTRAGEVTTDRIVSDEHTATEPRLHRIANEIWHWCAGAQLAVIEAPTLTIPHGVDPRILWLYHELRIRLWRAGIPFALASPQHVKIYAAGTSKADKDTVLIAAIRAFPGAEIGGNDEADAAWLAAMGCDWAGHPLLPREQIHTRVITGVAKAKGVTPIKGVTWPAPLTDALALAAVGGEE